MKFVYSDGGRSNYYRTTNVGDCVTRAICNATGKDYKEVYDALNRITKESKPSKRERGTSSSRDGVHTRIAKKYIEEVLGWVWHPTMGIGTGCQVHLAEDELPTGNLILNLSRHFSCTRDGVLYDTYDCTRDGNRCVYGYWSAPTEEELAERAILEAQQREYQAQKAQLDAQRKALTKQKEQIRYRYSLEIEKLKRQIAKLEKQRDLEIQNISNM